MSEDPFYSVCALSGRHGHECDGRITWEHALIYKGSKLQEPWSIIPLCEKAHAVNSYQDAGTMKKELNVWIALNQGTEEDLRAISKAVDYIRERHRLNTIYGTY